MAEERKLVTVLFADVVGSTSFGSENEPEVVRHVMARYFERMKTVAETYGGTVEKFIGDAVMVVFGIPRVHDDDAERAVRCALEMQEAMVSLNRELGMDLAIRLGINSGRAVTGVAEGQFLVSGDTSPAGHSIGPPQPQPTPDNAARSVTLAIFSTWRSSDSRVRHSFSASRSRGVGTWDQAMSRPPGSQTPAAIFVPPISITRTGPRLVIVLLQ